MKLKSSQQYRIVFLTFMVSGLLSLALLASIAAPWGTAYGQTAGPGPVTLTKTANPTNPNTGDTLIYTITVLNGGTIPVKDVVVTDEMPGRFEITNVTASKGTVRITGQRLTITIDTLGGGETVQVVITSRVKNGNEHSILNLARVRFIDPTGNTQEKSAEVNVAVDAASSGPGGVIPGLPNTGTGTLAQTPDDQVSIWKWTGVAGFGLVTLGSLVILIVSGRRRKS